MFNIYALIILPLIGVTKIGLYLTLRPLEKLLESLQQTDISTNFALRGNFAPIS